MNRTKLKSSGMGNFYNGQFHPCQSPQGEWINRSPADFSDEIGRFQYSYTAIDDVVQSARAAFPVWRRLSLADRAGFLKNYQSVIKKRQDELAEIITREVGKPLWEAKAEVNTMINKVDVTLTESMRYVETLNIPKIMANTDGVCRYRPLGVMAVIGPFNFPAHLPNGHIVPALLTGNTVVFKPSEKAPLVGQMMAEFFQEAGLPPGVFNLLQGEREVGRRFCIHEGVDGVLFTGSYEVGTRIKQDTLQQHWKLLALEMGGKNSTIVWDDAHLDSAVYEVLMSAFVSCGQRCTATSRVIVHQKILDSFVSRLHEHAKAFSIGHPLDNPFMGPLIDQGSVDRYMKFLGMASRENFEMVMRGKALELSYQGNYVTPSICLIRESTLDQTKKSMFQQTELFAPCVAVLGVKDIDDAIEQVNSTQYGLAASVFSKSRETYERCLDGLEMGLVNWNKSTVGASSRLPFGGVKKSGNHFPTGVTATLYCTYPMASLESTAETDSTWKVPQTPGLNW